MRSEKQKRKEKRKGHRNYKDSLLGMSFLFRMALSDEALGQTGQASQTRHAMWLWIRVPRVPAEEMPSLGIPQGSLGTIPRDSSPRLVLSLCDELRIAQVKREYYHFIIHSTALGISRIST